MAVEIPQNEKIFEGGKNEGGKKSVLLSVEEKRIGGSINIKERKRGRSYVIRCWPLHNQSRGQAKRETW